jgi:hypothetical protein
MRSRLQIILMVLVQTFLWAGAAESNPGVQKCIDILQDRNPAVREIKRDKLSLTMPSMSHFHLIETISADEAKKVKNNPVFVLVLDEKSHLIDSCLAVGSGSELYDSIWSKSLEKAEFRTAEKGGKPIASLFTISIQFDGERALAASQ